MSRTDDRFRRLVEQSPDGVLVCEDARVVYLNRAAAALVGVTAGDQRTELSLFDLVRPESRAAVRDAIGRWIAGEPLPRIDALVTTRDGDVRDVEIIGAPLESDFDDDDRRLQMIVRDVTERRRAEVALRESEERLMLAFAGAQEGVWDWNLETNACQYSPRWKQMLGYADDEIKPLVSECERLMHPEDRPRADAAHESVARGAPTYEAEFRLRHKDGHYIHVLSRGFPVRRAGRVVRIVGTHLDLTQRHREQAALRESEERLTLAFAGAQEGVWDWNLETGAVVYSPRWKEMLGYADDEIEPHVSAWERLLHPEDMPQATQLNERVAQRGGIYEGEFRLLHKDGHYVHVLSRGYPVRRDPNGPVVRIVGTHFDLTERRQIEAERTRTEFLTRLVFAQEDERRRIAREMHDQFGEQLTELGLRIRALKRVCADTPDLREQAEALESVAKRLDSDVDHLVWELRPTALDDLGLRAALATYVQDWSRRVNIAAQLHTSGLQDDRLPSEAETTLYRIAQEALTNVAKHSRAENVDVILERRADSVLLIVEDDGVGFELSDSPTNGQSFGLLGMRERAALVGATLQIESAAGKGTTVLVRMAAPLTTAVDHV